MKTQNIRLFFLPALLFIAAGCQTIDRRIEENAELFATFEPEVQRMIRDGEIDLGYTPDMVAIAWGEPDVKQVLRSRETQRDVWTYLDRQSVFAGRRFAGYEHEEYFDPNTNTHVTFMRPVYVDIYRTLEIERDRVEFEEGNVVSITRADDS